MRRGQLRSGFSRRHKHSGQFGVQTLFPVDQPQRRERHVARPRTVRYVSARHAVDEPAVSTVHQASFETGRTNVKTILLTLLLLLLSCYLCLLRRNGLVKDIHDERAKPLLHIVENIIPKSRCLKYVLVENVKGFECSSARDKLVAALSGSGFTYREFLLSPVHFGICNSRLRYYLLAKKKPLDFAITLQNDIVSFFFPDFGTSPIKAGTKSPVSYLFTRIYRCKIIRP